MKNLLFVLPNFIFYFYNYLSYLFKFGIYSHISPRSFIFSSTLASTTNIGGGIFMENCTIDKYTYIVGSNSGGINTYLYNVKIGKFCSIAHNVQMLAKGHRAEFVSTYPFYSSRVSFLYKSKVSNNLDLTVKPIEVKNDVWIGANVIILGGVTVGNGAIIGAGSVVTKNVPDYSIVVGNPAKVVKMRFDDLTISKLLHLSWWDWEEEMIKKNIDFLMSSNVKNI